MSTGSIRILFIPRESYPTDRVRINVLFGAELPRRGHQVDLVMQAANAGVAVGDRRGLGSSLSIAKTDDGPSLVSRLRKHWLGFKHDLSALRKVRSSTHDVVVVSDKFVTGVAARVVSRIRGVRFVFWLTFPFPEIDIEGAKQRTARYPTLAMVRGVVSGWLLYRVLMRSCDHVFVQSERMKVEVCKRGAPPERVSPIVTGFDLDG